MLYSGVIDEVYKDTFTCDVSLDASEDKPIGKRKLTRIPWAWQHSHFEYDSSFGSIPKAGMRVLICEILGRYYVLQCLPYRKLAKDTPNKINYKSLKEDLSPGDWIARAGRIGNKIIIYESGVIKLECTPLCRTTFHPDTHTVYTFSKNMLIETFGGRIEWNIDDSDNTNLLFKLKSNALKEGYDIILDIGKRGNFFKLKVGRVNEQLYNFEALIKSSGELNVKNKADVVIETEGKLLATAKDFVEIKTTKKGTIRINNEKILLNCN